MCTVTWWRDDAGAAFGVCFNRDEQRARPPSLPVRVATAEDGTAFLAPRDGAAGGTWLLANARGLVVALLNHYTAAAATRPATRPARSRGLLPLKLAACRSVVEINRYLPRLDLRDYAPCIVVAWDADTQMAWTWNGWQLATDAAPALPVTTSSFRPDEVCTWRRTRFVACVARGTPDELAAYHDDVAHADPAFNVRMRRSDARTESVCGVTVTRSEVRFRHRREAPDRIGFLDEHEASLARR